MIQGYVPEQPVFGPGQGTTNSAKHIKRYVRTFRVLQNIARIEADSCLDVGAAEGYTASLVKKLFGMTCVAADQRPSAGNFARSYYGLDPVAIDAHRLPFRPNSFDIVISTETVEHLPHPVEAMLEMARVARKAVLVSTCEATPSKTLSWISRKLADYSVIGGHINFFTAKDFHTILGPDTRLHNQFIKPGLSREAGQALRYEGSDLEEIKRKIRLITWAPGFLPGCRGIVALRILSPSARLSEPKIDDDSLLDSILGHVLSSKEPSTGIAPEGEALQGRLECPTCARASELTELLSGCPGCNHRYQTELDVPILTPKKEPTSSTFDRDRYRGIIERANLSLSDLESQKEEIELRSGVSSSVGRAALKWGRKTVETVEGVKRAYFYLGAGGRDKRKPTHAAE